MPDFCEDLDNLMVMDGGQLQDLIDTIVNRELLEKYGYNPVTIKPDDPANPICAQNQAACWNDDDKTLYYKPDRITQPPPDGRRLQQEFLETLVHEGLHAMDYKDRGSSSAGLGDERSDNRTVQLYDEYGEDGEKMYEPGDLIPGDKHMEEVYEPAREIAEELTELCDTLRKAKSPEERESIKKAIQQEIQDILEDRWDAEDAAEDEEINADEQRRRGTGPDLGPLE